jgi:lysophospholipase L1-like esterase/MoaA/NifB/PqqE/SkfB family radical SAM enzyme
LGNDEQAEISKRSHVAEAIKKALDVLCYGDSISRLYASLLSDTLAERFPQVRWTVRNHGADGETSRDGLRRLETLARTGPDVAVIAFGMNDRGTPLTGAVELEEFGSNLEKMVQAFEASGSRVVLLTMNPNSSSLNSEANQSIRTFNDAIRRVVQKYCVRLADIYEDWTEEFGSHEQGLSDGFHPNLEGLNLYCRSVSQLIMRPATVLLWQYNGNPCACNYKCPYCSYPTQSQKGHYFQRSAEQWRQAYKKTFRNRHLVFYFGHGEPMVGKEWFSLVEMIGREPNWEMRAITNLSPKLDRLLSSPVAREGRLNLNGSFHPTEITKEKFLEKLIQCRDAGIEVPVVYTVWPPFFERIRQDIEFFHKHGFLVHLRRFRGMHEGRLYPEEYDESQRRYLARHMDEASAMFMLPNEPTDGYLTWTGVDFFIVDHQGNFGYCDDYDTSSHSFGNVFEGNFTPFFRPKPFPRVNVSDGTVDNIANLVELDYPQLQGNHISDYSRHGGVCKSDGSFHFRNANCDFDDSQKRAEFRFPARNFSDVSAILKYPADPFRTRVRRIAQSLNPRRFSFRDNFTYGALLDELVRIPVRKVLASSRNAVGPKK